MLVIAGTKESDVADVIMAAAFVHRIFTWFLPILSGFAPLCAGSSLGGSGSSSGCRRV